MDYQDNNYEGMDGRYTGNRNLYCDLCMHRCRGVYHVIERGDTLYSLSKRYHVTVSDLMRANPYVNVYNLRVGEELCIPVRPQPRMEEELEKLEPPVTEEQVQAESRSGTENQFTEQDTLKEVLDKTGLSMAEFMEFLAKKTD